MYSKVYLKLIWGFRCQSWINKGHIFQSYSILVQNPFFLGKAECEQIVGRVQKTGLLNSVGIVRSARQAGKALWQAEQLTVDEPNGAGGIHRRDWTWSTGRQGVKQDSTKQTRWIIRLELSRPERVPRWRTERSGEDWSEGSDTAGVWLVDGSQVCRWIGSRSELYALPRQAHTQRERETDRRPTRNTSEG